MIDIVALIPLISALCSLFIFSYVFGQRKSDRTNKAFLQFSLLMFLTCMVDFLAGMPFSSTVLIVLTRIGMVLFITAAIVNLDFIYAVIGKARDWAFYAMSALTLSSAVLSLFTPHHIVVRDFGASVFSATPTLRTLPFFLSAYLPSLYGFYLLYRARGWIQSRNHRKQVDILFGAMLAAMTFYSLLLIVTPLVFQSYATYRFASVVAMINIAFVYYAIRKYKFLSVDTVEIEAVSKLLFENFRDAVIIADLSGIVIQTNEKARQMFGDVICAGTTAGLKMELGDSRFESEHAHFTCEKCENEETRHLAVSKAPINNAKESIGEFIIVRDITEDKRFEAEMAGKSRLESLGLLAGGIAHDFNNQLTGISSAAELLKLELGEDHPQQDLADMIGKAARRSSDLTNQLLAFARKGKFQNIQVNIHSIVRDVIAILERSIDKKIHIEQILLPGDIMVKGDPSQLHHALLNLALNSRDAMPGGGTITFADQVITLEEKPSEQWPAARTKAKYVELLVTDTGIGMDEEIQEKVFEPFFTTKAKGKGTGMGLAAVYGTVQNHGGKISVDSRRSEGTTMRILLPLASSQECTRSDTTPDLGIPQSNQILIVDDEDVVTTPLSKMLTKEGHIVSVCSSGPEAIKNYKDSWKEIDLVLLDIMMPDLDGYETYEALRRINPHVKVLMMSGFSKDEKTQRIVKTGGAGFIQKPFSREDIISSIAEITERPELQMAG